MALAVYEAGGTGIHLPLEPSNPLLAILKQAVEREGSEGGVGQTLAHALLENVLQAVDEQADSFPSLIVRNHLLLQPHFLHLLQHRLRIFHLNGSGKCRLSRLLHQALLIAGT